MWLDWLRKLVHASARPDAGRQKPEDAHASSRVHPAASPPVAPAKPAVIGRLSPQHWPKETAHGALDAFYGNPRGAGGASAAWVAANLVNVTPPWRMVVAWGTHQAVPHFQFHRKAAPSLERILSAIFEHYGRDQHAIEAVDLHLWGGTFNYRPVRGSSRLSCHAYGCAIDLAPDQNPLGHPWHADAHMMARPVIDIFKAESWTWGGDFHGRKDAMHFQATSE